MSDNTHRSWHNIRLKKDQIELRPILERDWAHIFDWINSPEIRYFFMANEPGDGYSLKSIQEEIVAAATDQRYCFMIIYQGQRIGFCWLQHMNLTWILDRFPNEDCRRIDMAIGEKAFWNQGIGTQVLDMLLHFGFMEEGADYIFGVDIEAWNPRSLAVIKKQGFKIDPDLKSSAQDTCWHGYLKKIDFLRMKGHFDVN